VPLSLRELRQWVPEIADLARATRDMAVNHANSSAFYGDIVKATTWQGQAAQTAIASMQMAAASHDVKAADLSAAAAAMDRDEQDAAKLAHTVQTIVDDADEAPAVQVDQSTNQVSPPPNFEHLDKATQAQIAEKITALRGRIAEAVAEGNRIDADLAGAIGKATGTPPPAATPTSLGGLLGFPQSGPVPPPPMSEARRNAVAYADQWAGNESDPHRGNPGFENFGDGGGDCTNFASQVMRAGGFQDVGNPLEDLKGSPYGGWYYENSMSRLPGVNAFDRSNSWSVAQANRDFVVNSGRGQVVANAPMPERRYLDPLAPSKAGLQPGDLIYYHDAATGRINHTAVYVGQKWQDGGLVDVVDQHANGTNNLRNDWMPDGPGFTSGSASVEFVHLHYPGD
jgi:cell wall-associated NlpC family hydrolase